MVKITEKGLAKKLGKNVSGFIIDDNAKRVDFKGTLVFFPKRYAVLSSTPELGHYPLINLKKDTIK